MIKVSKCDKGAILKRISNGELDSVALSTTSLVDDIILSMHKNKVLGCLCSEFADKRASNTVIPFEIILALAIAAKMRIHTSLSDIPYALTDHRTMCELGYSLHGKNLKEGLMSEGTLRFLFGKYTPEEFIESYNKVLQKQIMPKFDIIPDIHILDCTKLEVHWFNNNYEGAGIGIDKDENPARGYKLSTLRGICGDTGIIEDIRFGPMNIHDLDLSKEMMLNSPMIKPGDIIINDRGFISREVINKLKTDRGVDTYVPLRKNMEAYKVAVSIACKYDQWEKHPSRSGQKICFVHGLGACWVSENPEEDVDINACVVRHEDDFFVFITTDTTATARQIILTYEMRPEIEEDYRQLKDFWKLEDFKSTKLNIICFHIVSVLFGYLFFQLYTLLPEGEAFLGKSLPVVLKRYRPVNQGYLVFYCGGVFGVLTIFEAVELYAHSDKRIQALLGEVLKLL